MLGKALSIHGSLFRLVNFTLKKQLPKRELFNFQGDLDE